MQALTIVGVGTASPILTVTTLQDVPSGPPQALSVLAVTATSIQVCFVCAIDFCQKTCVF